MKFHHIETVTGDLILIKTNIPPPPPCPVIAQSAKPAASGPGILVCFALWVIVAFVAPIIAHWPPVALASLRPQIAVLTIVVIALIEVLAQGHVEKALGLMT